jgi:hypothetical protein
MRIKRQIILHCSFYIVYLSLKRRGSNNDK